MDRACSLWNALTITLTALILSGCVSVAERNPLPAELVDAVSVPGGEYARFWGDISPHYIDDWFALSDEALRARHPAIIGRDHHYLAISGGGQEGAFGAGLLCGWTQSGTRPEFTFVTGISTGALMAPFAFLGPEYDELIEQIYTTTSTRDILDPRSLIGTLTSNAMASSEPLKTTLERVITADIVEAIALEHRKGRSLFIGTTNLDAGRPVHWDIGEIANSGDPGSLDLIRQILLASASIPGIFPPVLIEVEADGKIFDEMHVDGGTSEQLFFFPAGIDWNRVLDKLDVTNTPNLYLIRNSRIDPVYTPVDNELFAISDRSVSSMIRSQGIGNLYEIYMMAARDKLEYHLAYIPNDFDAPQEERFDPGYMKTLFDLGFELAKEGYEWKRRPPRFE